MIPPSHFIEPLGLLDGPAAAEAMAAGVARPLAGGPLAFALARVDGRILPVDQVPATYAAALARLSAAPAPWAGLDLARPRVMGILNVTPDSFSDGGTFIDPARAVAAGLAMMEAGADLVDVGGESTRPGSLPTSPEQERARVVPVVRALAGQGVMVSVDTRNAATMAAALDAGARVVNDISALGHDPDSRGVVAAHGCPVVLMHMRHDPESMTRLAHYDDVALEVAQELAARIAAAEAAGIDRARIAIDPGVGFAKTAQDNLALLPRLRLLLNLGCPLVVGVSRKSFIGRLSGEQEPRRRAPGSIAAGLHAVLHGASVLRVHDVPETVQALRVWRGLTGIV
ncbi:dihydropteroate synthase [Limobrevibacterium gyesilva]|uniref:Dihydropteroate synthase n=1 Tax=Limobrevibacterium gyesilva TaxID=2991712 RepID=A0AA41YKM6_9PROT|nr:dihydropteroate synthase [Limobrevibacterium gyesilva]MCW3474116.1 dihydropteroate synthase [Limobrevibacterium gyesilva]